MTSASNDWDFVIDSDGRPLRSAIRELGKYRDLLVVFVKRDLVEVFKQTLLGPLWIVLQPLLTTGVFAVVFGGIADISTAGVPGLLFYLVGVTAWGFFAATFTGTANLFVANQHIYSKVYFPRLVSVLATIVARFILFAVQAVLFSILALLLYRDFIGQRLNAGILLLPIAIVSMGALATGLGLLVTASTVRYRDFRKLVGFGTQLLLYASPVIYAFGDVPESIATWLRWNPLTSLFESLRAGILGTDPASSLGVVYSVAASILILTAGVITFHRVEQSFVDEI